MTGRRNPEARLWRQGGWMDAVGIIASYHPRAASVPTGVWNRLRSAVAGYVTATLPCSAASAQQRMRVTAQFLAWCERNDLALDPELVFTEDTVEAFFAAGVVTTRSRSTFRSQLRTVAKANTRRAVWTPTPEVIPHVSARPPYTPAEVDQLLALVNVQNTARRRRVLDVTLHIGLGLGLTAPEILGLCREDIRREGRLVLASVGTRVVPARQQYAEHIWRLAQETDGSKLLGDHLAPKRSFEVLLREVIIPSYAPEVRVRRLRTTWLVNVLSDGILTLPEFQLVSGLTSGRVLDDIVEFVAVRDDYLRRAAGV